MYALVQVQIHNTHIHIQRGYVGRYIKGESMCMTEGYFKMISRSAICRSASLYMKPYDSCLVLLMPLTSPLKISVLLLQTFGKNLSQTETHTYTHPWFPAGLYRPIHSPQDKRSPSREKKRGRGIWPGLQPSKRAQPGLPNAPEPSPRLELTEAREKRKRESLGGRGKIIRCKRNIQTWIKLRLQSR